MFHLRRNGKGGRHGELGIGCVGRPTHEVFHLPRAPRGGEGTRPVQAPPRVAASRCTQAAARRRVPAPQPPQQGDHAGTRGAAASITEALLYAANHDQASGPHLLAILVKVVEPELMSTWRTRFSNAFRPSSSTRRKAWGRQGGGRQAGTECGSAGGARCVEGCRRGGLPGPPTSRPGLCAEPCASHQNASPVARPRLRRARRGRCPALFIAPPHKQTL